MLASTVSSDAVPSLTPARSNVVIIASFKRSMNVRWTAVGAVVVDHSLSVFQRCAKGYEHGRGG
jgi:hypothetical protein